MILYTENKEQVFDEQTGIIKCPLCGYSFRKGKKTFCERCPFNYGRCNFEKCPHCGYDVPRRSYFWDLAVKTISKLKG